MTGRTVLVCGGRDYVDREKFGGGMQVVRRFEGPISRIIHGGAPGADTLAGEWAAAQGIPVHAFPADWRKHGKRAGPIRNQQMLNEGKPDLVVAFPGGRGTADMVRRARAAGVPVVEVGDA